MYYKSHDQRNFYSTLCHTAKRNQRYNLIQSTQNDSTSVEYNSKTLTQNKFNTRQSIQNLTGHVLRPNQITFARAVSRVVPNYLSFVCRFLLRIHLQYIDKRSRGANLLIYSRINLNSLERALRLNGPEHSTISEL